jgi:hypothetical protein
LEEIGFLQNIYDMGSRFRVKPRVYSVGEDKLDRFNLAFAYEFWMFVLQSGSGAAISKHHSHNPVTLQ